MKKGTKITYLAAAALLVIGIALAFTGLALAGWRFEGLGTKQTYEEKTFTADAAEFYFISIEDLNRPIKLAPSSDGSIHVTYYESELEGYDISSADGKLTFTFRTRKKWYQYIGFNFDFGEKTVRLEVPAGYDGTIELSTQNSSISAENLASLTALKLKTVNGDIEGVEVSVSQSLGASTTNGGVKLTDIGAKALTAKTTNGKIALSRVDSAEIALKNVNGDISGSVCGSMSDYSIESGTVNGKNNLPSDKEDGSKSLKAETVNGDINIQFIK
jgi:DUF4097 and DUF4098 domain-containing protein YvlB